MKQTIIVTSYVFTIMILCAFCLAQTGTGESKTASETGLPDSTIADGLLEALTIGSGNAVDLASKTDGYFKNSKIKIPLPKELQKAEDLIRTAGLGDKLDEFVLSMNRAAEEAAPKAKPIFLDAVKGMSFTDARKILQGNDNEATIYFKEKTYDSLRDVFQPVVGEAMSKVEVTKHYQDLEKSLANLPISGISDVKLDKYVTEQALDGLFKLLAEEEAKIRKDPSARLTDILKNVFGK
ncbi:DUF4197 domain-containing protein [bacterium]|nr:DUF4197 domain-containing protein [candidate division CSSED10-310 bacterium]